MTIEGLPQLKLLQKAMQGHIEKIKMNIRHTTGNECAAIRAEITEAEKILERAIIEIDRINKRF